MQHIPPNHPRNTKTKMKQRGMFWRTNFAKSPGIILKSQAAASRQGEMYGVIEAWLAAGLSVPNASANRGTSLKQNMSQYVHILTVPNAKIDSNRFSQGFHLWIPFFLFAVFLCHASAPRCNFRPLPTVTVHCQLWMGHGVPRFKSTKKSPNTKNNIYYV